MFQPQPTPFAASCFNSYGAGDLSFPLSLQTLPGASSSSGSPDAGQPRPAGDHVAPPRSVHPHPLPHHQRPRQHQHQHQHPPPPHPPQSLLYNASASASVSPVAPSHGHFSPAPPHPLGSPYSHATPPSMEQHDGGLMQEELAAQEAAAREYQPRLEVSGGPAFPSVVLVFRM